MASFMSKSIVLVALFAAGSWAFPIFLFERLPEQFKEFLPDNVRSFYTSLTPQEKAILKDFASKDLRDEQAWNELKAKSPKLYAKADELRTLVRTKVDSLKPEGKAFVNGIFEKLRGIRPTTNKQQAVGQLKEAAKQVIEQYNKLSPATQNELKTTFPKIVSVIANPKFQALARGQAN